jgi:hypothetical protein
LNSAFIGVLKSDFQTSQSLQSYEILVIMKRLKRKVVKEVLIAYCMLGEPPPLAYAGTNIANAVAGRTNQIASSR